MRRLLTTILRFAISAGTLAFAGSAAATLIVPMSSEDLADSAEIVVTGTVSRIVYSQLADGSIVTRVSIAVDESWKGDAAPVLELVERGGTLVERGEIVYGSPTYQLGEPVLVFAAQTRLGWRTNHMLQGKFRIEAHADGQRTATREIEAGVAMLAGTAATWRAAIPLEELRAVVRESQSPSAAFSTLSPPALEIVDEVADEFTTQANNPRFFEADIGDPLVFLIDDRGDSILGFEAARRAVDDAFSSWNANSGTSLELRDGGTTDDISTTPVDGFHKILFDDPGNDIFPPTNCSGTLGLGGSTFSLSENKTFGGRTFNRILSASVKFADGWDGCPQWIECNVSEVAGHEVGHAFGLGHSSMNPNEGNADLRQALMYFMAHFDDRCSEPRTDDIAGTRAIYPEQAPITITTPGLLPEAVANQPYSFQLSVAGGRAPITWSRTGVCAQSDGGLELSPNGEVQGPLDNVIGNGCMEVIATDADGNSHQKRFAINFVATSSSPSPTSAASATPTPTTPAPTAMPTNTATRPPDTPTRTIPVDRPCVGDCDGNGQISISELIRGVNIALGRSELSNCPSFDRNSDGRVAINELVAAVTAALFGCTS